MVSSFSQSLNIIYYLSVQVNSNDNDCDVNIYFLAPAYASALMESLRVGYSRSPQALRERSAVLSSTTPAPLSRSLQKINKDEAVGLYLAQHSRFNTGH